MLYIFTYTNTDTHSNAHTHINFIRITIGVQIKEWSVHLTTTFLWIGIKEFNWWNHISTVDNLSSFDIYIYITEWKWILSCNWIHSRKFSRKAYKTSKLTRNGGNNNNNTRVSSLYEYTYVKRCKYTYMSGVEGKYFHRCILYTWEFRCSKVDTIYLLHYKK